MSGSRSPERQNRRLSETERDRPDQEEQPAKRLKADVRKEDQARGKRLFGNILGTLQKFQKDDKTSRTSEAVKRREQVSERIQNKIRSEANLHHEIAESERELKSLRIQTDSAEYIMQHKEAAMLARHKCLAPTSHFLHTSPPAPAPLIFEGNLLNPSPIPLNKGPSREPPQPEILRPLYFLPKILLAHQQSTLDSRIANIAEQITDESTDLAREKESLSKASKQNRERIEVLSKRLSELRSQVRPEKRDRTERGDRDSRRERAKDERGDEDDDFGRSRREDMEVDRERELPVRDRDLEREREGAGQIRGDDGDIEVEY